MTTIEWTDATWNPFVGCSKISAGCTHCYAINQAYRNNAMAQKMPNPGRMKYYNGLTHKKGDHTDWTGTVRFVPEALEIPLKWRKGRKIFVNSMSDLFHEAIPDEQIDQVFRVMALTQQHIYQVLTKRPKRMLEYLRSAKNRVRIAAVDLGRMHGIEHSLIESCQCDWPLPNVWLGMTVENQAAADERIPLLLQTPAANRFLSCEPLLEKIDFNQPIICSCAKGKTSLFQIKNGSYLASMIDWVIIGGESGSGARQCNIEWIESMLWQCKSSNIPAFIKQLGSNPYTNEHPLKLCDRKGANLQEWPKALRVREFPESTR
jgi:protein gp37